MKTVMVTGVCGMIGRATCEALLDKDFKVIGTDTGKSPISNNEGFVYVEADISDKKAIKNIFDSYHIDVLVHLACSVDNDFVSNLTSSEEKFSSNVDKFLYQMAADAGVTHILLLSSHMVYAPTKSREPVNEEADVKPTTIYGNIKYNSEKEFAKAIRKADNTMGTVMRICPIYTSNYFENLITKIKDPRDGTAFIYGFGEYGYSYTHLNNLTEFIVATIINKDKSNLTGSYNVVDTKPILAKEIVEWMRDEHKIGAVVQRNYGSDNVKTILGFGTKAAKSDYRYNDLAVACANVNYTNIKAKRISSFRWNISNTKEK